MDWGSDCGVNNMLVGANTSGGSCVFHPVARGSAAAGPDTKASGSHDVTFHFVRFKGGSDGGAGLIDLGGNFGSGLWSGDVKTCDMVDTNWYDCEFERPQGTGAELNIWLDCRRAAPRSTTTAGIAATSASRTATTRARAATG